MKKTLALLMVILSTASFGQVCFVDMVDSHNRIIRSFSANGNEDSCVEGMKQCRKSIRLDYSSNPRFPTGSLSCVVSNDNEYPIPAPTPAPRYETCQQGLSRIHPNFGPRDLAYVCAGMSAQCIIPLAEEKPHFNGNELRFVCEGQYDDCTSVAARVHRGWKGPDMKYACEANTACISQMMIQHPAWKGPDLRFACGVDR